MWDLPGSGIEPVPPAMAGEFFTAEPPGKPDLFFFNVEFQANFFTLLFHPHQEALQFLFASCHYSGIICISEVVDISPGNLDSSLCFIQPGVSHDVL